MCSIWFLGRPYKKIRQGQARHDSFLETLLPPLKLHCKTGKSASVNELYHENYSFLCNFNGTQFYLFRWRVIVCMVPCHGMPILLYSKSYRLSIKIGVESRYHYIKNGEESRNLPEWQIPNSSMAHARMTRSEQSEVETFVDLRL